MILILFSGNRPPLILGRPEEGSGYQIDSPDTPSSGDESDQRSDINFMYRISNHLYGKSDDVVVAEKPLN